jgi:hypothetical protein
LNFDAGFFAARILLRLIACAPREPAPPPFAALQRLEVTGRVRHDRSAFAATLQRHVPGLRRTAGRQRCRWRPSAARFRLGHVRSQPADRQPLLPDDGQLDAALHGLGDGEPIDTYFEHTNQGLGPVLLGVQTFVQRDREFEDGLLVEDTFDYFAQDTDGNVWYFGEDSTAYEYDDEGNLIDTDTSGSWHAGVNDALPGFIMPVDLETGFNYYQEFAPDDEALDQATTYALLASLTTDSGTYENVLQVLETTELEPDEFEFKYYAPGIGLILVEEGLDENLENPETVFTLQPRAAPEPTTLGTLFLGFAMLGAIRLRRPKPLR